MRRDEMAIFFVVHIFLRLNFVVGIMCYKNDIFFKITFEMCELGALQHIKNLSSLIND